MAIKLNWLLILLLTIYAPLELSRVIIEYGIDTSLLFELCFIWLAYLIALIFVWRR